MKILFLILFISLYALLNFYVGKRIYSALSLFTSLNKKLYCFIYILFPLFFTLYMLIGGTTSRSLALILYYPGTYYLGAFFYLLMILPIIDLIKFLFKDKISLKLKKITSIIVALSVIFILILGSFNAHNTYIKEYEVTLDEDIKESSLNVVLVSDIHLSNVISTNRLSNMVNTINSLNPDFVLIAGDLIDMSIKPFIDNNMAEILGKIKSKYGTYFSLGNHDVYAGKNSDLTTLLSSQGINVLNDEAVLVNESFYIVGRMDKAIERFGVTRKSISELVSNLDKSKPIFLIDHTPDNIADAISSNISLQVSGHTHKGQMSPGNIVTSMIFPLDYGYQNIDGLNLVVSSGYGYWGPPLRIGSKSEIVNIKINSN